MSGTRIRQKFAKKRSLHGVNEHFSQIFNAIIVPRSNRAKVSNGVCFEKFGDSKYKIPTGVAWDAIHRRIDAELKLDCPVWEERNQWTFMSMKKPWWYSWYYIHTGLNNDRDKWGGFERAIYRRLRQCFKGQDEMSFLEWPCELFLSVCTILVATKALLALILGGISIGIIFIVIKEIIKDLRK